MRFAAEMSIPFSLLFFPSSTSSEHATGMAWSKWVPYCTLFRIFLVALHFVLLRCLYLFASKHCNSCAYGGLEKELKESGRVPLVAKPIRL